MDNVVEGKRGFTRINVLCGTVKGMVAWHVVGVSEMYTPLCLPLPPCLTPHVDTGQCVQGRT